ncbi:MAG TPA: ECF transporter S component [Candidatus Intestinimonas pullistercoris]|uniref:ECF transporter S component n=1 Tax=Candidatus Intestinimonas pullistercoris TaxID=2838623 RepID=A0A9D2P239_9FIRM|nr:ECF transporter S component [uncultured Intestinimonas sp.]HJC41876.1 ECF transporter S component [Candidatus Intestinimonas pullistercoris]
MSDPTLVRTGARPAMSTKTITTLAMLSGIAYVVMLVSKLLPSVNGFLDFDFKDVVICIGGFTFGPVAAAVMAIVVAFVEMITISTTGLIGFVMNVLATCGFCCTATFIYKKRHTMVGAVLGLGLGVVVLTVVMLLWNYFLTPIYQGLPREAVADMLVPIFLPFNLAKGGMNMAATLLLYKPVVTALRKAGLVASSQSAQPSRRTSAGFLLFSLALLATFVMLALVLLEII